MSNDRRPRVTVGIPTAGLDERLRQTVESVLSQSFDAYEVVVSDQLRTNELAEAVAAFDDERVRCEHPEVEIDHETNVLRCLRLGDGEYVAVLLPGSTLTATSLADKVEILDGEPGIAFAHSAGMEVDDRGRTVTARIELGDDQRETGDVFIRRSLATGRRFELSGALLRRTAVRDVSPVGGHARHLSLSLALTAARHGGVAYIPDVQVSLHADRNADPRDAASRDESSVSGWRSDLESIAHDRAVMERLVDDHEDDLPEPARLRDFVRQRARTDLANTVRAVLPDLDRHEALEVIGAARRIDPLIMMSRPVVKDGVKAVGGSRVRRLLRWAARNTRKLRAHG